MKIVIVIMALLLVGCGGSVESVEEPQVKVVEYEDH
jgi:uncharacterized lipoprotein YmbA